MKPQVPMLMAGRKPKTEGRRPREVRNPKAEKLSTSSLQFRDLRSQDEDTRTLTIRISAFGLPSVFGLRVSDFYFEPNL